MKEKLFKILGSIRFYVILCGWLADYLAKISANGFDLVVLFQQIAFFLGSVAVIGSADSIAQKINENKQ
jgi:hypothetical protein